MSELDRVSCETKKPPDGPSGRSLQEHFHKEYCFTNCKFLAKHNFYAVTQSFQTFILSSNTISALFTTHVFHFLSCTKNTVGASFPFSLPTHHPRVDCPHLLSHYFPSHWGPRSRSPFPRDVGLSSMKHSCSPHLDIFLLSQLYPRSRLASFLSASSR